MWKSTRNVFYKTRAIRNTCSKGNIDRSKCVLAATGKVYVYILRSKCEKDTRNVFYKTRAARSTGSKGNVDRSKCSLATTDETRAARNSCSKGNIARKEISNI